MIVGNRKSFEEILEMIKPYRRVFPLLKNEICHVIIAKSKVNYISKVHHASVIENHVITCNNIITVTINRESPLIITRMAYHIIT